MKKFKIGDKIKCNCCDELKGTINKIYNNEKVGVIPGLYSGYGVIDETGYEMVCDFKKAVLIEEKAKVLN